VLRTQTQKKMYLLKLWYKTRNQTKKKMNPRNKYVKLEL